MSPRTVAKSEEGEEGEKVTTEAYEIARVVRESGAAGGGGTPAGS